MYKDLFQFPLPRPGVGSTFEYLFSDRNYNQASLIESISMKEIETDLIFQLTIKEYQKDNVNQHRLAEIYIPKEILE